MEPLATVSGLATGIDFREVVDQIIKIEDSRLNYLRRSISDQKADKAAWEEVRDLLEAIESASEGLSEGSGLDAFTAEVLGDYADNLSVSANSSANEGSYSVRVLQVADREALSSSQISSRSDALGISGQIAFGGAVVEVAAADSLVSIASAINQANTGEDATGVSATIVGSEGAYRLIVSADATGEEGLGYADVDGVMASLGLVGSYDSLKTRTGGGFASDELSSSSTEVGTLLGFSSGTPSGTVTLAGVSFAVDLATDSLEDIRDNFNIAAGLASSSAFAAVEEVTTGQYRLSITGTASASDDDGVLAALGVLQADTSSVSQVVQGGVLASDAGGTPADASTLVSGLFNGASSAGVNAGDTVQFEGTKDDGSAFSFAMTLVGGEDLQDVLDLLNGAQGFDGSATASITDGRLTVTSGTPGVSLLSLDAFAGNEGGGILDFGSFSATTQGRDRMVSTGQDALVEIDGVLVTSSSNAIDDAVDGVTFTAVSADASKTLSVEVSRDTDLAEEAVKGLVDAVNGFFGYVSKGIGQEGAGRSALAGDSVLRGLRTQIGDALRNAEAAGASGTLKLFDVGVEITREGAYSFESSAFTDQMLVDPSGVEALISDLLADIDVIVESELTTGSGSISGRVERIDESIDRVETSLFDREQRLEVRREQLLLQYTKLEQSISLLQGQQSSLAAVSATLPKASK
jgi:flagellar hook-associated protein 2